MTRHTIILIVTAFVFSTIYTLNHIVVQKHLSSSLNNNLETKDQRAVGDKVSDKWSYEEFIEEVSAEEDANKRVVILAGPHKTGK